MASKQLLCRFYSQGSCIFGDSCLYSHDAENSVPIADDICLFYLRSNCLKGPNCPKLHKTIAEIVNSGNATTTTTTTNTTTTVESVGDEPSPEKSYLLSQLIKSQSQKDAVSEPTETSDASESIPKSYASAASVASSSQTVQITDYASIELCSFFETNGFCLIPNCSNIHGDVCDLCCFYSLHPYNEKQRETHRQECIKEHEKSMEASFAYQRSKDLTCGICLDVIMEKESRNSCRFGILENCVHIYCIECIRTWRKSNFDKKNKRGCPQCRVKSDFVIPSEYFYEDNEEKTKMITEYKNALSAKNCKYFKNGEGKCPFEGACFYKHEYPDGRKAELPMPSERRKLKSQSEDYAVLLQSFFLDVENIREILSETDLNISDYENIFFIDE